jgi:non-homologous end joining protein Ku
MCRSIALGVTFTTREHVIAIEPRGKGLLGVTLRYPYEIRREENYFGGLPEQKVPKEMLDLATHIIATRRGHFDPNKFEDHYETTLQELIKKKRRGETIERPKTRVSGEVINLMDALRKSIAAERGSKRVNQKPPHVGTALLRSGRPQELDRRGDFGRRVRQGRYQRRDRCGCRPLIHRRRGSGVSLAT